MNIPYAICGGMALFAHGFERFTKVADLVVTAEDLWRIHHELSGRGFLPPFEHSKHLRDTNTKVRVEFFVTGQYPGDGKPKSVSFPHPNDHFLVIDDVRYVTLPKLIELKLASGMTSVDRRKDLVDVQELFRALNQPRSFASQLDASVAEQYRQLWDEVQGPRRRYMRLWAKASPSDLPQAIHELPVDGAPPDVLQSMAADGIELEASGPGRYVTLVTSEASLAMKYNIQDERDILDPDA